MNENIINILNSLSKQTLMEALDIRYIYAEENLLKATMPVNNKTTQPEGILHGGATLALCESVGSGLSYILIDSNQYNVVGTEINANHLRSVKQGIVTATATLLHKGKTSHVADIKVTDENNRLIAICRMTNRINPKNNIK